LQSVVVPVTYQSLWWKYASDPSSTWRQMVIDETSQTVLRGHSDCGAEFPERIMRLTVYHQGGCTNTLPAKVTVYWWKNEYYPEFVESEELFIPRGSFAQSSYTMERGPGLYSYHAVVEFDKLEPPSAGTGLRSVTDTMVIAHGSYNWDGLDGYPPVSLTTTIESTCENASDKLWSGTSLNDTNSVNVSDGATNKLAQFVNDYRKHTNTIFNAGNSGTINDIAMTGHDAQVNTLNDLRDSVDSVRETVEDGNGKLDGIGNSLSNLVGAINGQTNAPPGGTNGLAAQNVNASAIAEAQLSSLETYTASTGIGTPGDGSPVSSWVINIGTKSLNLNPTQFSGSADFFAACKAFIGWFFMVALFMANWRCLEAQLRGVTATPQGTTAGTSIAGTNANAATDLTVAILVVAAMAVVPAYAVSHLDKAAFAGTPDALTSMSDIFQLSLFYINLIFPFATAIACIASHMAFRMGITYVSTLASFIVRLLVGV